MECNSCQEHVLDYIVGTLSAEVRRDVEKHLSDCPSCAAEAAELSRTWKTLGTLPEEKPSPGMRARFYAMLEEAKAEEAMRGTSAATRDWERLLLGWWPRRPVLQFAVAVVLLMIGLGGGRLMRPEPATDGDIATLRSEIESMRQEMTIAMLNQASSVDRLLAISNVRKSDLLEGPVLETLIKTANLDPSVNVRLAAVDALSMFLYQRPVREEMRRSLVRQTSPMVQISLIDALSGLEDGDSRRAIQNLIEDRSVDPDVQSHARMRLEESL